MPNNAPINVHALALRGMHAHTRTNGDNILSAGLRNLAIVLSRLVTQ